MDIIERIIRAREEAIKHDINANKILLSDDLAFCKGFEIAESIGAGKNVIHSVKPMILGLEVEVIPKDKMPDKVAFIITNGETSEEHIRSNEREKIKEALRRMSIYEINKFLQED